MAPPPTHEDTDPGAASLCVLASGSAGNCSVLEYRRGMIRRACLIDLGISPRRTFKLLAALGLQMHQIDDVLLTHLDADHYHAAWERWLPRHVRVRIHEQHFSNWSRFPRDLMAPFDGPFRLQNGAEVHPLCLDHDAAGVVAYRFDFPTDLGGGSLGFATDVGRVTRSLIDLFRGSPDREGERESGREGGREGGRPCVDVLAIESNYCPEMQLASGRPEFLKRRIMGGRGHLSNQEAFQAVSKIGPREHVVLLHLSRDCNNPDLPADLHAGSDYALTIAGQAQPTRWIHIRRGSDARSGRPTRPCVVETPSLFEHMAS